MLIKTCSPLCNGLGSPLKKKTFLSRLPNLSQNCLHPFFLSCLLLIELVFQIKRLYIYLYIYIYIYMYVHTYGSVILLVLVALKPRDTIITALCSALTKSIRAPASVWALWDGGGGWSKLRCRHLPSFGGPGTRVELKRQLNASPLGWAYQRSVPALGGFAWNLKCASN